MFDLKEHLRALVESHAPSGHEGPIRTLIQETWDSFTDEIDQDKLGSLIGIKRATQPVDSPRKIMLAAHMDEIGMMVRDIVEGFIYVHRISGVDNRVMLAQPVLVHGKRALPGIVATIPTHLQKSGERNKYLQFDDLVIDVGLPEAEVNDLVRIGDLITLDVPMIELKNGRLAAKTMDDRACVAAVTGLLALSSRHAASMGCLCNGDRAGRNRPVRRANGRVPDSTRHRDCPRCRLCAAAGRR